jgi:lipoprotein-releasing system permease protein
MMSLEMFINWRYLRSRRKQIFISVITFFSMAGIFLGVAALIIVLAVMNGFAIELRNKILGVNSHLVVTGWAGDLTESAKVREVVRALPEVKEAVPFVIGQAMIKSDQAIRGAVVKGVDPLEALEVITLGKMLAGDLTHLAQPESTSGKRLEEGQPPKLIVGSELARQLGIHVADRVTMVSPFGVATPMGQVPRVRVYELAGIFESGFFEYDSTLVVVAIPEAQSFFNLGNRVTGIEAKLHDLNRVEEAATEVRAQLGPAYFVRTWMEMNRNLFAALKLERRVMFIILSLIVLVAAFNIISSLIMNVMEKNRDIAILKAMGATSRHIMTIFVLHGLVIGLVGTFLGCLVGLAVAYNLEAVTIFIENLFGFRFLPADIYYLSHLPSQVVLGDVLAVVLTAISISFLATLYPSWKAARLDPVAILRNE